MNVEIDKIIELKLQYENMVNRNQADISEEKVRSGYLNKLLEIFGWNLSDTSEIIEEKVIRGKANRKLKKIQSKHKKPDYQLLDRGNLRMYLDAKNAPEDFSTSEDIAFQIRSYGWSSDLNISVVSNFGIFGVYDTSFKPDKNMSANYRAFFFTIEDLISDVDKYGQFLDKETIIKKQWELTPFFEEFHKGDSKPLDKEFLNLISEFRIVLGKAILEDNSSLNDTQLNYYVQVIINRLVFIRILEDLDLESYGTLETFIKNDKGFWNQFKKLAENSYRIRYDGALFDEVIDIKSISDKGFDDFINSLYTNSPYRFDVIKPSILAQIYDEFLGKQLIKDNKEIKISYKLLSHEGIVPTPSEVSNYVVSNTLDLNSVTTEEELLKIKILDPCVGSGSFLISAFNILSSKLSEIKGKARLEYLDYKNIVINCLHGVDIDLLALEVLKMTISIRLITSNYAPLKEPLEKLLSDFSQNFQWGNTIVRGDGKSIIKSESEKDFQNPTDYIDLFPEVLSKGDFDYILGNPPYIEPKYFKEKWPETYNYLKVSYVSGEGKTDISMYFIERFFELAGKNTQIGIIIQNRFFKTEYGNKLRNWLVDQQYLSRIIDFRTNKLFKKRITYVSIIIGNKLANKKLMYELNKHEVDNHRSNLFQVMNSELIKLELDLQDMKDINWSYSIFKAKSIMEKILSNKSIKFIEIIGKDSPFDIQGGLQVLDSKFFILKLIDTIDQNILLVQNRLGENFEIEKELIRKVLRNDSLNSFIDFSEVKEFDYILFPYDLEAKLIPIEELKRDYPRGYLYLEDMLKRSKTKKVSNKEEFYRFTRETNHKSFSRPKVFFPMTAKRIVASYSQISIFGDNSNMWTLVSKDDDINLLKAMCVLMNSYIFSLLAIIKSGDASNNYRKLNKQFVGKISVPELSNENSVELSKLYDDIETLLKKYKEAISLQKKKIGIEILEKEKELNRKINCYYGVTDSIVNELFDIVKELGVRKEDLSWTQARGII
ncbi:Eco57I restriction-modification methylase domain-containing protein [Lactococcus petauri]|uniref:Eco57I restriction-modification methylase domain-containing protein n=1 Tax=Lactococcus petauri TaxID=1940789 RepID=UPI00254B44E5|nr:N-6 DNA methylase [Lactococcus petauri]